MQGEQAYLDLLRDVLENGVKSNNRTATDTYKVFGRMLVVEDVGRDFPLLTTKRVHFKSVLAELVWFLSGSTNAKDLQALGCTIWDEWAKIDGDLGPIYGQQWRRWNNATEGGVKTVDHFDQIKAAEKLLRGDPNSRRNLVSAWNVADLGSMALMPCHYAFQLQTSGRDLNLMVNMRSIDIFLGLPFNLASYALLLRMFAHVTGYRAKRLCISLGDLHLYENHVEQARTQLARVPFNSPTITLDTNTKCMDGISIEAVQLSSYKCHPPIKGEVAV